MEILISEYEGKKELLLTQIYLLTGIERERIALIEPKLQTISYEVLDQNIENRVESNKYLSNKYTQLPNLSANICTSMCLGLLKYFSIKGNNLIN